MCAYGPNLFGYANEGIDNAAIAQIRRGDALTGPGALMVELAESMVALVAHADWAMFCKNGTDATSMALMTARAHTKRKTIIRAKGAYHGAAPWCTPRPHRHDARGSRPPDLLRLQRRREPGSRGRARPATISPASSPRRSSTTPSSIRRCPTRPTPAARASSATRPAPCWSSTTCAAACASPATAAGRWSACSPTCRRWGKCIANGHPISALLGSNKARAAAASIYVTGSFWYAGAPMAAGLATLDLVHNTDYLEKIEGLGERLRDGLHERAAAHGFSLRQTGPAQMPLILFDDDPDLRIGFCWSSEMLKRGIYVHPWHNMFLCAAMTEADIDGALDGRRRRVRER